MTSPDVDRSVSRRRLLQGGGALAAVAVAAGIGYEVGGSGDTQSQSTVAPTSTSTTTTTTTPAAATARPAAKHRFVSRPELEPPHLAVTVRSRGLAPGAILLSPSNGAVQAGTLIAGDDGEPIWFHPLPFGMSATNLRVQEYRGSPVLTWWEGVIRDGWGPGEAVIADASYKEVARLPDGNGIGADLHDFTLTPQGTALVTVYQLTRGDLSAVGGPKAGFLLDSGVQEVDVATGEVRFEWLAGGRVPITASVKSLGKDGIQPDKPFDPYHVNSVTLDADGDVLVSFRHLSSVYKIARPSGAVRWRLGGTHNDFRFAQGAAFGWQHDAVRLPDGTLSLFDNGGSAEQKGHPSRGLVLRVDEQARTASVVRTMARRERTPALSQGNLQVLADGSSFVGWGEEPFFTGFDSAGRIALEGRFVDPTASYRAFRQPWVGKPADQPAVAARPRVDGGTDVFASWNGATEIARWDVLTGPTAGSLRRASRVARTGFETTAKLASRPAYVVVAALDAGGRELGRSVPLRV